MEIATQQAPSVPVLLTALVGARFRSVRNEEREANLILRAESALDEPDDRARAWNFSSSDAEFLFNRPGILHRARARARNLPRNVHACTRSLVEIRAAESRSKSHSDSSL